MKPKLILFYCACCFHLAVSAQTPKSDTGKKVTVVSKPRDASIVKKDDSPKVDAKSAVPVKKIAAETVKDSLPFDRSWIGWSMIILLAGGFFWAAKEKGLLRDTITDPELFLVEAQKISLYAGFTIADLKKIPRPFSLSRTQLGLWTVVIGGSYLYVELCHVCAIQPVGIDSKLLVLMGLSAGTAAVGSMIDSSNQNIPHHQDGPSQGFLTDILSDQDGISIHRFQNVAWTIIAVVIYLCQLPDLKCGTLPTLDETLIALTGISNLTYLGLKVNENQPPKPPVAAAVAPAAPAAPVIPVHQEPAAAAPAAP